jgi:ethanolamine ammonia-lyase small subunit
MTMPTRHDDPWARLRQITPARVALGRAGGSLPTAALLDFQLAHALARDAVHQAFDPGRLARDLAPLGHPIVHLATAAGDRRSYLLRPDLGRTLRTRDAGVRTEDVDVSITLSDGLSALAAHRQIPPLLGELLPRLKGAGLAIAPLAIVPFARVAVEDEVGALQRARLAIILLGERPGLGSPDSLGAYLVYGPRVGRTDSERNCVSNIRPEGLAIGGAAELIQYLVTQSLRRAISGVGLKDERRLRALEQGAPPDAPGKPGG